MRCQLECGKRSVMAGRAIKLDPKTNRKDPNTRTSTPDERARNASALDPNEIAIRSYELWQQRGCPIGSPEIDWFNAEEELLSRL
jgi:hypothetical protein